MKNNAVLPLMPFVLILVKMVLVFIFYSKAESPESAERCLSINYIHSCDKP